MTRSDSLLLGITTGMHGVVRETKTPSQFFDFGNFTPAFLSLSSTTYLKHPLRLKVLKIRLISLRFKFLLARLQKKVPRTEADNIHVRIITVII